MQTCLNFLDLGLDAGSNGVHAGGSVFSERGQGLVQFVDRIHSSLSIRYKIMVNEDQVKVNELPLYPKTGTDPRNERRREGLTQ